MARTLPIPAEHRELTVKVGGQAVARENQLLAASISLVTNRLASARLVYLDGSASSGDFPLSGGDLFVPGAEIEVLGGTGDDSASLFHGVVIKQSLKVRERAAPQLIVECRHKAVKLTVGRKSAYWFDQKDSDVLSAILDAAGLDADVDATTVTHKQLVQYNATDWDYLLLRAEANGLLVFTHDEAVAIKAPALGGSAVADLQFGATLLDLDATIDARSQLNAVKGLTWDPAQQARVEKDGADPGITDPGDLSPSDLAGVVGLDALTLRHPAMLEDEAQALADAEWRRSQLNRVSGRARCEGIGTIKPGTTVNLVGVGGRFSGPAFVTGVRHEHDLVGGWKTHVQFGGLDRLADGGAPIGAAKAAGLLPGVSGLQLGVVVSNEDPDGEHRVRVRMPLVSDDEDGTWARVSAPDAGDNRGFFFRPEVGDEVVLGFLDDDPRQAVLLGMLHSSAKAAPLTGSDDNHEKVYQSRSEMKLYFNDDTKVIRIETPAGNLVMLSEEDKKILIEDQNGNSLEMSEDGIKIESGKAIEIKAGTELKLESGTALELKGGSSLKLEGTSGAELTSTATTKVKGSLVQIN